jgi:YVTN family beta-propeller protein
MRQSKYIIVVVVFMTFISLLAVNGWGEEQEPGYLMVLNKSANTAMLIDLKTDRTIATIPTGEAPHEVAVSGDGKIAVVGNYGTRANPGSSLSVIDLLSHNVVETIALGIYQRPHGLVFPGQGRQLLVTSESKQSLLLLDLDKKEIDKILHVFPTQQEISHMVAVTPDHRLAFTANIGSGSISVIDLKANKSLAPIPTGKGAEGLDVSPDGRQVWVSNRAEDTVSVIDVSSLTVKNTIKCPSFPIRLKFTPDGKEVLVSAAKSGELVFIDAKTYKEIRRLPFKLEAAADSKTRLFNDQFEQSPVPIGILIHPTGKWAYVAAAYADKVAVVDIKKRKLIKWISTGKEPDGLGFTYQKKHRP